MEEDQGEAGEELTGFMSDVPLPSLSLHDVLSACTQQSHSPVQSHRPVSFGRIALANARKLSYSLHEEHSSPDRASDARFDSEYGAPATRRQLQRPKVEETPEMDATIGRATVGVHSRGHGLDMDSSIISEPPVRLRHDTLVQPERKEGRRL